MVNKYQVAARVMLIAVALAIVISPALAQENWDIYMTVDNQFDVYFGTPTATVSSPGGGNELFHLLKRSINNESH